jgi:hypothetical protein
VQGSVKAGTHGVPWGGRWRPGLDGAQAGLPCAPPRRKKNAAATGRGRGGSRYPVVRHTAQSKRPLDQQRSAATCGGRGGAQPPHGTRATGTTSRGCSGPRTRIPVWWESGCRVAPPGCAVTEQRCAWHPRMPSRHNLPQWHLLGRPWRAAHSICCGVHVLGTMADTSRPTVRARPRRGPTSARGLALTQEPSGMTLRSRARKEKSP